MLQLDTWQFINNYVGANAVLPPFESFVVSARPFRSASLAKIYPFASTKIRSPVQLPRRDNSLKENPPKARRLMVTARLPSSPWKYDAIEGHLYLNEPMKERTFKPLHSPHYFILCWKKCTLLALVIGPEVHAGRCWLLQQTLQPEPANDRQDDLSNQLRRSIPFDDKELAAVTSQYLKRVFTTDDHWK